jgi:glycosyltransferase involved in cell wall biosynthesis
MNNKPRVSVVISFLNAERFLEEAIESVFAQTFKSWELLLVDDGSSDSSSQIARRCSTEHPHLVKYLEHHNHRNRGLPASRNLGIRSAIGDYIALLDSDDVWLPDKLEQQVAILDSHSEVAMVSGATQYWRSWAGNSSDQQRDYVQGSNIPANRIYEPPALLKLHLSWQAFPPCPSDMLFRRESILNLGGFEESFIGSLSAYEDQAFLVKVYSDLPVFVSDECLDRYRLHPDSICAKVTRAGQAQATRAFYLNWLAEYLSSQGTYDAELKKLVQRELWGNRIQELRARIRLRSRLKRAARFVIGWRQ